MGALNQLKEDLALYQTIGRLEALVLYLAESLSWRLEQSDLGSKKYICKLKQLDLELHYNVYEGYNLKMGDDLILALSNDIKFRNALGSKLETDN